MRQRMQYKGYSILEVIVSTILITTTFLLFAEMVSKVLLTRSGADNTKILMQENTDLQPGWVELNLPHCRIDNSPVMINGIGYQKKQISNADGKTLREWYVLAPGRNLYYTETR